MLIFFFLHFLHLQTGDRINKYTEKQQVECRSVSTPAILLDIDWRSEMKLKLLFSSPDSDSDCTFRPLEKTFKRTHAVNSWLLCSVTQTLVYSQQLRDSSPSAPWKVSHHHTTKCCQTFCRLVGVRWRGDVPYSFFLCNVLGLRTVDLCRYLDAQDVMLSDRCWGASATGSETLAAVSSSEKVLNHVCDAHSRWHVAHDPRFPDVNCRGVHLQ